MPLFGVVCCCLLLRDAMCWSVLFVLSSAASVCRGVCYSSLVAVCVMCCLLLVVVCCLLFAA